VKPEFEDRVNMDLLLKISAGYGAFILITGFRPLISDGNNPVT
jgi:hypothetical protein